MKPDPIKVIASNHRSLNWPMIAAAAFTASFYSALYLLIFG